jgi:hypothetical protein
MLIGRVGQEDTPTCGSSIVNSIYESFTSISIIFLFGRPEDPDRGLTLGIGSSILLSYIFILPLPGYARSGYSHSKKSKTESF